MNTPLLKLSISLILIGSFALTASAQPSLPKDGHLYFHRYASYEAWDGEIWRYDLANNKCECLSDGWPLDHAMNARFSSDGTRMLFMAVEVGQHRSDAWDIFLWQVNSKAPPINLTQGNGLRDEDPQWSPDGQSILFKQSGSIALMNLATRQVKKLLPDAKTEQSMPIYVDKNRIVYMSGEAEQGDLQLLDLLSGESDTLVETPNVQDYFPVPWDARRFLFVRWAEPDDHHDQVYQYVWSSGESFRLPFCQESGDNSDPCPIDYHRVLFSSTREGSLGGYDIYLGDAIDGSVTHLELKGVNTASEELASVYVPLKLKKPKP